MTSCPNRKELHVHVPELLTRVQVISMSAITKHLAPEVENSLICQSNTFLSHQLVGRSGDPYVCEGILVDRTLPSQNQLISVDIWQRSCLHRLVLFFFKKLIAANLWSQTICSADWDLTPNGKFGFRTYLLSATNLVGNMSLKANDTRRPPFV